MFLQIIQISYYLWIYFLAFYILDRVHDDAQNNMLLEPAFYLFLALFLRSDLPC